jgi:hypothetical protein
MFEDLAAMKSKSRALSSLRPCDAETVGKIRRSQPGVPTDYIEFLRIIGAGQIGDGQYTVYTGLVKPRDIFRDVPAAIPNILLFGDDMQGFCAGFDPVTWKVVEIDPNSMTMSYVSDRFETFIRKRCEFAADNA